VFQRSTTCAPRGEIVLLSGVVEDISYKRRISCRPPRRSCSWQRRGRKLRPLPGDMAQNVTRLTEHKEKDGQGRWSPASGAVFRFGPTGKATSMSWTCSAGSRADLGGAEHLYPNGRLTAGGSPSCREQRDHDIAVIDDMARSAETTGAHDVDHDDIRPVGPRGKKVASIRLQSAGRPRIWSIIVVAADGSDPRDGTDLLRGWLR